MQEQGNPQNAIFQALDSVPSQVWYTASIASILASAIFQIMGRKQAALFVGQWPPTFLAVGLYHKLVRPGNEDALGQAASAAQQAASAPQQIQESLQ